MITSKSGLTRFEKEVGISNSYFGKQLKRKSDLGEGILNKIVENCLEINPIWLLMVRYLYSKEKRITLEKIKESRGVISC